MRATEAKLLDFLKKSAQLIIPIYQRTYSWTEKECQQLWDDILSAGDNKRTPVHFIGSVVYIEQRLAQVMDQSPLLVIDGQQRLTTVSLLLEALARRLGDTEPFDGFSARKIRDRYLVDPLEDGDRAFKLVLTQTDKESLISLVRQRDLPQNYSVRVKENFEFFNRLIAAQQDDLLALCKGLAKLVVVDVALDRGQDNPQLIFESMNSTGKELSQADLIRNFILMGLEPNKQTRLYKDHWRPMELDFGQEAYGSSYFDKFIRYYLTIKTGEIPKREAVYESFKAHVRSQGITDENIDEVVSDLQTFSRYYCAMALDREPDLALAEAFQDLRELKVDVAYPFLMELYHDYKQGLLSRDDLLAATRLTESYLFRRAVCEIPTNSHRRTFALFGRSLKKESYIESIQVYFAQLPSYRRFPTDSEFKREIKTRNLYKFSKGSYWLRRLENAKRKERVPVNEYTIEHILPQNPELSKEWRMALGPEWRQIQQTWLHTLGNLTLTGYNQTYRDSPFPAKRDLEDKGFRYSPLKLNKGLGQVEVWNETAIQNRAERLADEAVEVWYKPEIDSNLLADHQNKPEQSRSYTIADQPYLARGTLRELFEAFRSRVLALDPCVTEDFLKLYVAYKAETNFVDVVPQSRRLRLSLNMRYPDIYDPKEICKDVTNVGRWGNGDVEVGLESLEELPYVMGLVQQAFEQQMGNGEEDL